VKNAAWVLRAFKEKIGREGHRKIARLAVCRGACRAGKQQNSFHGRRRRTLAGADGLLWHSFMSLVVPALNNSFP
jgi:hypothetical protein